MCGAVWMVEHARKPEAEGEPPLKDVLMSEANQLGKKTSEEGGITNTKQYQKKAKGCS